MAATEAIAALSGCPSCSYAAERIHECRGQTETKTHSHRDIRMIEIHTPQILTIDLGKFNWVCWYELSSRKKEHRTVPTCPAKMQEAIGRQLGVSVVNEAYSPVGR